MTITALAGDDQSTVKQKSPLEGSWKAQKIWEGQKYEPAKRVDDMKMEFRANQFTTRIKGRNITGLFDLDKTKQFNLINLHVVEKGDKLTIPAIYKIEGDILTLCHDDGPGGKLPTSFNVKNGVVVATYVKVKTITMKEFDEPVNVINERNNNATQVALAWATSLTQGKTAVTASLSSIPFNFDGEDVIKAFPELNKRYKEVIETKGKRNMMITSVTIESSSPEKIVLLLTVEGTKDTIKVFVKTSETFRVTGFTD